MLTYYTVLTQVITIIIVAYILRQAKMKQTLVISFGLISITYIMFKTSVTKNIEFSILEWLVIGFINAIGWHMCFYCKEERSIVGLVIMFLAPAVVLGSMF